MQPAVYILASKPNGILYIGVTSNLVQRVWQHKNAFVDSFTRRYFIKSLVYFELHSTMHEAITKEKQLKNWKRDWKIRLINEFNPEWLDLYDSIL